MATAKKPTTTKKTTARKSTPVKRTTAKKAAPRKTSAKRSSKNIENYETFKLATDVPPLMSFKVTKQTVYWIIIMAFVIFFQLWIIKLQIEVAQILDAQQAQILQDI